MPTADEYIMSQAAGDLELARLRANEAWMDEHTKVQLDERGVEMLDEAFADPNAHLVVMTVFSMRGRRPL